MTSFEDLHSVDNKSSSEDVASLQEAISLSTKKLQQAQATLEALGPDADSYSSDVILAQADVRDAQCELRERVAELNQIANEWVFQPLVNMTYEINVDKSDGSDELIEHVKQVDFEVARVLMQHKSVEEQQDLTHLLSQAYIAVSNHRNYFGDDESYPEFKSGLVATCVEGLQTSEDERQFDELLRQLVVSFNDTIKINESEMQLVAEYFQDISLDSLHDRQILSLIQGGSRSIIHRLLESQLDQFKDLADQIIDRVLSDKYGDTLHAISMMNFGELKEIFEQNVTSRLEPYDIGLDDFYSKTEDRFVRCRYQQEIDIVKALRSIETLEEQLPGSAKRLIETYGIKELYRYPADLLITQLEEEGEDKPFGLVMYGRWEEGGRTVFDSNGHWIKELADNVSDGYAVKIFEFESAREIARHLISLKERYPEHAASFAVIGDHGSADSTTSGISQLAVDEGAGHARVSEYLAEDAQVILQSCSTGALDGLAQSLSDRLGVVVYAPEVNSESNGYGASLDSEGKLHFNPEYTTDNGRKFHNYKRFE